jgi:hypothetical protein
MHSESGSPNMWILLNRDEFDGVEQPRYPRRGFADRIEKADQERRGVSDTEGNDKRYF